MNWVSVDLGTSTIKASVLDKRNKPIRLSYTIGDYETTLLSSVVAVTKDGNVVIGDYASQLGMSDPNMIVHDWLYSSYKLLIAKTFFETIYQASIKHYRDQNIGHDSQIGIVLLYDKYVDDELKGIAKTIFSTVETMCVSDVIKRIIAPNSNLMLIADFGEGAFRLTLKDSSKIICQNSNEDLGFSSIDILSLSECKDLTSYSSIQMVLLGQMLKRIKVLLNNGQCVVLPDDISPKGNSLRSNFEQKMTTYFYQCFEECTNALNSISKKWKDVNYVTFIGGGACSSIIDSVFEKYMQSYGIVVPYKNKCHGFDSQYAATHSAIQMPELRQIGGIVVEH